MHIKIGKVNLLDSTVYIKTMKETTKTCAWLHLFEDTFQNPVLLLLIFLI